jgi:hypothetical protein
MIRDRKQTTGRLYFRAAGAAGYADLGDVAQYRFAPEIKHAAWKAAGKGHHFVRGQVPYDINWRWFFTFSETLEKTMQLLGLSAESVAGQPAKAFDTGEDYIEVVAPEVGAVLRSYWFYGPPSLYWENWTDWIYQGYSTGVFPLHGQDYFVDPVAGAVTIATDYWTQAGPKVFKLDFAAPAMLNYTALKTLRASGDFRIDERDQFSEVPRETHEFAGQAQFLVRPDEDAAKPAEFEMEVIATGRVSTRRRKDT